MLREAAILAENNVQAWLALASLQNDLGQLDAARASLETALASKLNDAAARTLVHEKLAELYERLSEPEKQAQQLLAAMAHGADSAKLRPKLAQVLASLGRKDELVTLLETWAANAEGELADNLRREAAALCEELGQVTRAEGLLRAVVLGKRAAAAVVARDLERIAYARSDHGALAEALSYQLEIADAGERKPLLERLLAARVAAQDDFGAEASALELLELDPTYAPAHRQLAVHYEKTKAFDKALEHWLALIYETRREDEDKLERRQAFEHAAALALEIAPEHTGRLRNSFDREHPEAPPSAVARPYGELLTERGAFEELLALRRFQIAKEGRLARAEWRREAADILHHHLGRSAEAITYYQDVVAHQPDDAEARDALADILEALGRNNDLANLLFAMSQLVSDGGEALAYGQKSAELYAERLADEVSAAQVLRLVATRPDVDPDAPKLHAMLRRYGLFDELVSLLERSIGATPDPDDGRFVALVALLHKELKDPTRALAWCERMIEAFADADKPRRLQVDLLIATATPDQAQRALHAWAEARTGAARATVLLELARLLITAGRTGDGIAALEQAADADPKAEAVLEELIERSTAVGDFPRALAWLIKLARAKDPGVTQDELWRRVAQIATDYVDDLDAVAQALEGITHRTEDETRTLIELLAERGMLDALGALAGTAGGLPVDLLLKAGAALADGGMIDKARIFLEQAMARGEHRAVWEAAERGYRAAGKLEELGRWRLQAAKRSTATEAALLRLQGYADIAEAGHAVKEGLSPSLFESLAGEIDATSADGAWALFRAARAFAQPQWTDTAMRTLERVLTEDDPRLLLILHHRLESALTTRAHDAAVKLADRLLVLGDPDADLWMERVLIAAGRREDLLRYLLRRAEAEGEHAALLWIRIARWYGDDQQWAKAKVALERVPGAGRSLAWGELMCEVAVAVGDTASEAEGATVCAELAPNAAARAAWLRRAGRLWWWRLEEAERGQKMLVHAQALAPIDAKTAYEEALGVSFVGRRAMVSMKHVGLNVAADPFMNSALVAIAGGLGPVSGAIRMEGISRPLLVLQSPDHHLTGATVGAEIASWGADPALLDRIGLASRSGRDPFRLSRGEQKRLVLGCALATDADLLVLDEPFASLDVPARVGLGRAIAGRGGVTIVMTHADRYLPAGAARWRISGGRIVPGA